MLSKKKESRISRDEVYLRVALTMSQRGTCERAEVGCVIVCEHRIVASGYVGSPAGMKHCLDAGCLIVDGGCVRTVHAECSAIAWAAKAGTPIDGGTLYSTHSPCLSCAKLIINAGIVEVKFMLDYRDRSGIDLLREARKKVVKLALRTGV